jgi:hypothetical protein
MNNNYQYLFISSVFRSGSALLSRIINAHSKVEITDDKLKFFLFTYQKDVILTDGILREKIYEASFRLKNRWGIVIDRDWCYKKVLSNGISYGELHRVLTQSIATNKEKIKIIGELEAVSWRNIEYFLNERSNGKAIILFRDLRDVVCSFKKNTISPGNDYLIALFNVIDSMDYFLKYQRQFPNRFLGIRYEDLKSDTKNETKKICTFLGIDFEDNMINPDYWSDDMGGKWENTQVSSFYDVKDHANPMGRWRKIITEEDLFLCEWLGRGQMKKFSIKPEGKEVSQEIFDNAINKLNSSPLLRDAFRNWAITGSGMQKYPIDPTIPKNWDRSEILNIKEFID